MSKRSEVFRAETVVLYPSNPLEPGEFFPVIDSRSHELADLFQREEDLAALLSEGNDAVDSGTIFRAIAVAREIAYTGYPTILVSPDEMADIAQIFAFINTDNARVTQNIWLAKNETLSSKLDFPTRPVPTKAYYLLEKLLHDKRMKTTVWTAKVLAALAYLSVEKPS